MKNKLNKTARLNAERAEFISALEESINRIDKLMAQNKSTEIKKSKWQLLKDKIGGIAFLNVFSSLNKYIYKRFPFLTEI